MGSEWDFSLGFVFVGCWFVCLADLELNRDSSMYHYLPSAGLGDLFVFWVKIPLLCSPGYSRTSYVDQIGLKLRAFAIFKSDQVLVLKEYATTPASRFFIL